MKYTFIFLFSFCYTAVNAQIIGPDTVCLGTSYSYSTNDTAVSYAWDFNSVNVVQPVSPVTPFFTGAPLNSPSYGVMQKDGANYYYFAINYGTEQLIRFSFGTSIHNTPVVTNLGSLGMVRGRLDGLDIIRDDVTGNWYGLLVDDASMGVLSFGSSLSNVPTSTVTNYPCPVICWGHQVTIKKYNGNYIAFLANRNSNVTRFDFGSSLTNPPVANVLPNVGGVVNPVDFTLYEQAGNWYMLVSDLIAPSLVRYNFGPSLLNNTPTGTSLGNPGGLLILPRSIKILNDCQNNLIAYLGNENGTLIRLDFAGDITNVPVPTSLGPTGIAHWAASYPVSYSDSFAFICVDAAANRLWIFNPFYFSPPTVINYYNPVQPFSSTTIGTRNFSLFEDMGRTSGPSVHCKSVYVGGTGTTVRKDTTVCSSSGVVLSADSTGTYLWNTGATTPSITVSTGGTYWVTIITGPCRFRSDTFNLVLTTGIPVNLGNDTAFCIGNSLLLNPVVPAGSSLNWSTGATGPSITVSATGTYWVTVTNGSCSGSDTIRVIASTPPVVDLGPDTSNCLNAPMVLQSSVSYTAPAYYWNNASAASSITVTTTGTYWLRVTVDGCPGYDTVNVIIASDTFTLLNNDTAICRGEPVPVFLTASPGATFQWLPTAGIASPNIATPVIRPDTSAMYYIRIYLPGCPVLIDSFYIDVQPNPIVSIEGNGLVCEFDTLHLRARVSPGWYTNYKYSWTPATYLDDSTMSSVVFLAGDSVNLFVTVTTPVGCSGTDSTLVTVFPGNFSRLDTSISLCPHDSAQFIPVAVIPTGNISYVWHPGIYLDDSTATNPLVRPITSQAYTAVATSQYGCRDTITANVIVHPGAVLYLGDSVTIRPGESYQLDPKTNCVSFTWFPVAGLDNPYVSNPIATPQISTRYKVSGITEWGCEVEDSISIYFDANSLLALPNAFVPGGNINSKLFLLKRGAATLNYFRIFNRWGNLVFETTDINEGWDGTYKGKPQPFGVFVYEVEAIDNSTGRLFQKHGNVTLVR